jgi:hypothetical protein
VYTTCLFCTRPLGTNEVLERFPVGRRVAFDAEKGRLWVVCPNCERWNLTPLEERWEAIEQAEQLYRDTRLRVATDNIGLARLPEGLELVRIGRPLRPEIAAWRYGDQFGRRRRNRIVAGGAIAAGGVLIAAGGLAAGIGVSLALGLGRQVWTWAEHGHPNLTVARLRPEYGMPIVVRRRHLTTSRLLTGDDGLLALDLEHSDGRIHLQGARAGQAAGVLFPAVNSFGGTRDEVQRAAARLDHAGGAERYLATIARSGERLTQVVQVERDWMGETGYDEHESGLLALPISVRLAIEMALHEDQERRALEGELAELEQAWREAEEIGAIADSLLLPSWIDVAMKRLRSTHA